MAPDAMVLSYFAHNILALGPEVLIFIVTISRTLKFAKLICWSRTTGR